MLPVTDASGPPLKNAAVQMDTLNQTPASEGNVNITIKAGDTKAGVRQAWVAETETAGTGTGSLGGGGAVVAAAGGLSNAAAPVQHPRAQTNGDLRGIRGATLLLGIAGLATVTGYFGVRNLTDNDPDNQTGGVVLIIACALCTTLLATMTRIIIRNT